MATANRQVRNTVESTRSTYEMGDQMPYRMPRGKVTGSRAGLHIAQILAVLLTVLLFLAIGFMARWQWG